MNIETPTSPQSPLGDESFPALVDAVKQKFGNSLLTDQDLLLLACDALVGTFTYDEQGYR